MPVGFFVLYKRARRWRECGDGERGRRSGDYGPGAGASGSRVGSKCMLESELAGLLWATIGQLRNIHRRCRRRGHGAGRVRCAKSGDGEEAARRDRDRNGRMGMGFGTGVVVGDRLGVCPGGGLSRCTGTRWIKLFD